MSNKLQNLLIIKTNNLGSKNYIIKLNQINIEVLKETILRPFLFNIFITKSFVELMHKNLK